MTQQIKGNPVRMILPNKNNDKTSENCTEKADEDGQAYVRVHRYCRGFYPSPVEHRSCII